MTHLHLVTFLGLGGEMWWFLQLPSHSFHCSTWLEISRWDVTFASLTLIGCWLHGYSQYGWWVWLGGRSHEMLPLQSSFASFMSDMMLCKSSISHPKWGCTEQRFFWGSRSRNIHAKEYNMHKHAYEEPCICMIRSSNLYNWTDIEQKKWHWPLLCGHLTQWTLDTVETLTQWTLDTVGTWHRGKASPWNIYIYIYIYANCMPNRIISRIK